MSRVKVISQVTKWDLAVALIGDMPVRVSLETGSASVHLLSVGAEDGSHESYNFTGFATFSNTMSESCKGWIRTDRIAGWLEFGK